MDKPLNLLPHLLKSRIMALNLSSFSFSPHLLMNCFQLTCPRRCVGTFARKPVPRTVPAEAMPPQHGVHSVASWYFVGLSTQSESTHAM